MLILTSIFIHVVTLISVLFVHVDLSYRLVSFHFSLKDSHLVYFVLVMNSLSFVL